jgi:hypothetical protein
MIAPFFSISGRLITLTFSFINEKAVFGPRQLTEFFHPTFTRLFHDGSQALASQLVWSTL